MLDFLWKTDLAFGRFSELEAYTCYETYPDKSYTVRLSLSSLRGPLFLTLYTLQQFVGAPVSTPVFRYIAPGELFIRRLGGGPVGAGFQGSVLVPPVPPRKLTLSGFEPNCTLCLSRDGIIILLGWSWTPAGGQTGAWESTSIHSTRRVTPTR